MALMCRRKVFSVISRYRLSGRFPSSPRSIASSCPAPPSLPQMPAWKQLRPATGKHSSLAAPSPSLHQFQSTRIVPLFAARNYTATVVSASSKDTINDASCFLTHKCTSRCGCRCMAGLLSSARSCTTTAYPPPTPPGEFQGGDEDGEADGAPLNIDEAAAEEGAMPPEDFDMPPFDDPEGAEEEGDYVDEDPPPDPEEALLFSPSDAD